MELKEWAEKNKPSDQMIWKGAAAGQVERFAELAGRLELPAQVVSTHSSKSIKLPVVMFEHGGKKFYVRDNFHDYNLCVVSDQPFILSVSEMLEGVQESHSWEWYLEQMAQCRGYTWRCWTDEEIADPRILRVFKVHPNHKDNPNAKAQWWDVRGDLKDRWLKRMTDPEWYVKDWSSGGISWDGEFGPGVKIFVQSHPYMQGIEEVVPHGASEPYKPGCKHFALALGSIEQVEAVIRKLKT